MKFLTDVNIPLPLIRYLIKQDHKVQDARTDYPAAKDVELITIANKNDQIILTRDKDFLELTKYPKHKVPLIMIRLTNQQTSNIVSHFANLLTNQSGEVLMKSITIIKEEKADSFPFNKL